MPITVQIPTALRRHTAGVGSITCAAANLGELFSVLDEKFPELKPHLRDDQGQVRRFLNVYVNEEDIRFLGGTGYAFQEGDEVLLVPSIAGGKTECEVPVIPQHILTNNLNTHQPVSKSVVFMSSFWGE